MRRAFATVFAALSVVAGGNGHEDDVRCPLPKKQGDLNSFLWRVERSPPAFLFGTVHVPYERVWPFVPGNAKRAFALSHSVYFELDVSEPRTLEALSACQRLPHGETLPGEALPVALYSRLKHHLEYVRGMMPVWLSSKPAPASRFHDADAGGGGGGGGPNGAASAELLFRALAGDWERKRPVWLLLLAASLTEGDVRGRRVPSLDAHLARLARRLRKRSGAVERVHEQCAPLNAINGTQVVAALEETLTRLERLRAGTARERSTPTEELILQYNCGDLASLILRPEGPGQGWQRAVGTEGMAGQALMWELEKYFRKELVDKRNARMARRVHSLLVRHPDRSFFFAFGAGHFLGNGSVIDVLRQQGFRIHHVPPDGNIDSLNFTLVTPVPDGAGDPRKTQPRTTDRMSSQRHMGEALANWADVRAGERASSKHRKFSDLWVKFQGSDGVTTPAAAQRQTANATAEEVVEEEEVEEEQSTQPPPPTRRKISAPSTAATTATTATPTTSGGPSRGPPRLLWPALLLWFLH
ncbi:metalloprotease TIKI2 [Petromyzon marinus]|uniref:Metalloprotease TIKI n=1 Tax=Petromyzon marinus TaxID=7757 RepID=A0AAJ7TSF2_PETMA|nr:metalloprotease TIKI1-like [Petromyzon marinus]